MILGKVIGNVVSTKKNEHLKNNRILVVQPINLNREPKGQSFLALDVVDAGEGDLVVVNKEGGGARIIFNDNETPVQAVIVAIVDNIECVIDK